MDSDEKPDASVFSTSIVCNNQNMYYPIFQHTIDASLRFSPANFGTNAFFAICNKRFFVSEIEEHAELCLTRNTKRNIICITNDSNAEDTTSYIELNGNDTDKSDAIVTKSQFLSKIKSVLKNTIFTNEEAKLNIRRDFSFVCGLLQLLHQNLE